MPAPPLAGLQAAGPPPGAPMQATPDQMMQPAGGAMGKNPFIAQAMALVMQTQANPDLISDQWITQLMKILQKAMEFTAAPGGPPPPGGGPMGGPPPGQ